VDGIGVSERRWALRLALVVSVGVLLGRLGPFDTFSELRSVDRYAYWLGLTLLMWLQSLAVLALIEPSLRRRGWPHWAPIILAALLASIPTAIEVAWAEMFLRVQRDLGPGDVLAIFGDVALLAVPLLFLTHGWPPPARPAIGRAAVGDDSGEAALMTMLEPRRRGALLAVCSEDHYVRIYTDRADQLIAMRFADALASLGSAGGMQVHRGWWVAADAVDSITRSGDGLQLALRNGMIVPVSRSYVQQVRKAWPDRL
jgi:hypothetical protein